mgnify:CR=1
MQNGEFMMADLDKYIFLGYYLKKAYRKCLVHCPFIFAMMRNVSRSVH